MKPGANKSDQQEIFALSKQGFSVDQISRQLGIYPKCVAAFVEHFEDHKFEPQTSAMVGLVRGMPTLGQQNEDVSGQLAARDATINALTSRLEAMEAIIQGGTAAGVGTPVAEQVVKAPAAPKTAKTK